MASRERNIELGVNFWLSNREIIDLRAYLALAKEYLPGHYEAMDMDSLNKWIGFFGMHSENGNYDVLPANSIGFGKSVIWVGDNGTEFLDPAHLIEETLDGN